MSYHIADMIGQKAVTSEAGANDSCDTRQDLLEREWGKRPGNRASPSIWDSTQAT